MAKRVYDIGVSSLSGEFWWYVEALGVRSLRTYSSYSQAYNAGWNFCVERAL